MATYQFRVGDRVILERRGCTGYLEHRREATIDRETPKRFYVGDQWIRKGTAVLMPQYLDTTTTVKPLEEKTQ